jgi:hypothetical protein
MVEVYFVRKDLADGKRAYFIQIRKEAYESEFLGMRMDAGGRWRDKSQLHHFDGSNGKSLHDLPHPPRSYPAPVKERPKDLLL